MSYASLLLRVEAEGLLLIVLWWDLLSILTRRSDSALVPTVPEAARGSQRQQASRGVLRRLVFSARVVHMLSPAPPHVAWVHQVLALDYLKACAPTALVRSTFNAANARVTSLQCQLPFSA